MNQEDRKGYEDKEKIVQKESDALSTQQFTTNTDIQLNMSMECIPHGSHDIQGVQSQLIMTKEDGKKFNKKRKLEGTWSFLYTGER